MLHPDATLGWVDDVLGYGVFATRCIPLGTITWVQDPLDQVLDSESLRRLGSGYSHIIERYTWLNRDAHRVLCWDFARFMNHSCDANTFSPGLEFEIAVHDIKEGDQITSDYGALNIEIPLLCSCGSPRCRGLVRREDFETCAGRWDELLRAAFPRIPKVEQPLWPFITEKAAIAGGVCDRSTVPSILTHRCAAAATRRPDNDQAGDNPFG